VCGFDPQHTPLSRRTNTGVRRQRRAVPKIVEPDSRRKRFRGCVLGDFCCQGAPVSSSEFHHPLHPNQPSRSDSGDNAPIYHTQEEPFVDPHAVAAFLSISKAEVLKLTRQGKIRGYAYKGDLRHIYRYRLSEVSKDFAAFAYEPKRTIAAAALVRPRRKSNG
jgi:hypothetical protein